MWSMRTSAFAPAMRFLRTSAFAPAMRFLRTSAFAPAMRFLRIAASAPVVRSSRTPAPGPATRFLRTRASAPAERIGHTRASARAMCFGFDRVSVPTALAGPGRAPDSGGARSAQPGVGSELVAAHRSVRPGRAFVGIGSRRALERPPGGCCVREPRRPPGWTLAGTSIARRPARHAGSAYQRSRAGETSMRRCGR
jgi:hypothetical protein